MTILNKVTEIEANKAFFKTYRSVKRNNDKVNFLIRKFDPYSRLAYLQMIGSTNHPESNIYKDTAFIKEIESFANFIKNESIRRDPSKSKDILNYKGVLKQVETWSNHSAFNGERDNIRSNMKKVRHYAVPKITIKEINDRFEREGKPYQIDDFAGEIEDKRTGKSLFIIKQGMVDE